MIYMTRRMSFSAALIEPEPIERDTERDSVRDTHAAGARMQAFQGHNYMLDVTVCGEADPVTGMVVNIKDIDQIVRTGALQQLDGSLLNGPHGPLACAPATPETILNFVKAQLEHHLPSSVQLTALRLESTPLDAVECKVNVQNSEPAAGEMLVTRVYEFAASHRLHNEKLTDEENQELFGKCNYEHGHGHNYILEITVSGPVESRTARVIDTDALDEIVNHEIVERYDHRHLNLDLPEFAGKIASSEVVVMAIWDRLKDRVPQPARLFKVVLRETARSFFEYCGEN